MKYLLTVSDSIIDDITERYPNIEIKPIKQPMLVGESGDSVYLTQPYMEALKKTAAEIQIEESVKFVKNMMYAIDEFNLKNGRKTDE